MTIQLEIGSPRLPSEGPSHSARLELTGPDDRLAATAFLVLKHLHNPWDRASKRFAVVSSGSVALLATPFAIFSTYIDSRSRSGVDPTEVLGQAAIIAAVLQVLSWLFPVK